MSVPGYRFVTMRVITEATCWAVVAVGIWLATLSSVTLPETCFALGAGAVCGIAAWAARGALGGSWRVRMRWLWWLLPLSVSILVETGELVRMALTRPHGGRLAVYDFSDEPAERLIGREAVGTIALSATPGTVVADCDPITDAFEG